MKYLVIFLSLGLMLTACKKENSSSFSPYPDNPLNDTVWVHDVPGDAPVYRMSADLSSDPLSDSFNASSVSVVSLSDNLDVTVLPSSLMYSNGTDVSGKVAVEVNYLKKKGDYIRFAKPTSSYVNPLMSAGAFYVRITQNGEELSLKAGKKITLKFTDPDPAANLKVFYGLNNLPQPVPAGVNPDFTWTLSTDQSTVNPVVTMDSLGNIIKAYSSIVGSLGWIDCARHIDTTQPMSKLTALLPANYTNTNTAVFAVFNDQNIVVQLFADYDSRTFFAPQIPVGSSVKIVSVSLRGTEWYLGSTDITTSADMIFHVQPEQKSKTDIEQYLDSL